MKLLCSSPVTSGCTMLFPIRPSIDSPAPPAPASFFLLSFVFLSSLSLSVSLDLSSIDVHQSFLLSWVELCLSRLQVPLDSLLFVYSQASCRSPTLHHSHSLINSSHHCPRFSSSFPLLFSSLLFSS